MAKYLGTTSKVPIFAHGMGSLEGDAQDIDLLSDLSDPMIRPHDPCTSSKHPLRGFILSADLAELLASVGLSLKLRGNDVPRAEQDGNRWMKGSTTPSFQRLSSGCDKDMLFGLWLRLLGTNVTRPPIVQRSSCAGFERLMIMVSENVMYA